MPQLAECRVQRAARTPVSRVLRYRRCANASENEAQDKQYREDEEYDLRDSGRSRRDDAKAEQSGDDGNYQECKRESDHGVVPFEGGDGESIRLQ
jgi:hypothetical protein